jgi:hypothetical protein
MKTLRLYGAGLLVALLLALAACGISGGGSGCGGGGGGGGGGSPDFTISLSPDSLTVQQGGSGTIQLTLTPLNGFTGTVSLSLVERRPRQSTTVVRTTLLPSAFTVSTSSPVNQTLTVNVDNSMATGRYSLKVRAVSGSLCKEANLSLTVTAGGGGGGGGGGGAGTTWTLRNLGNWLSGVTYGKGLFVAVERSGAILTSP